jgi:hypothetical protein
VTAPLTEAELARIEAGYARVLPLARGRGPAAAVHDALAGVPALVEEVKRLRAALADTRYELAALSRAVWQAGYYDLSAEGIDVMVKRLDKALGPPAAGGSAPETTEET